MAQSLVSLVDELVRLVEEHQGVFTEEEMGRLQELDAQICG